MPRKLALKKLKASDLSFFQEFLLKNPLSKQKGFNLDQRIIENILFPSLAAAVAETPDNRAPVSLTFYGPGGAKPYSLMRKILKAQKNWRLNGEVVHSPVSEPTRFESVAPEDIAIMEFYGASMPSSVKVVLLSAAQPKDKATHAAFTAAFPSQSMSVLTEEDIERVIGVANTPADHPIRDWLDKELFEEVGHGDPDAIEKLLVSRKGRGITLEELKKAKATAERIGREGEELLDYYFEHGLPGDFESYEWVAKLNPLSPFDFKLLLKDGTERHVDAKSTGAAFGSSLYLSIGELRHALSSGVPYDLYRLYNISDSVAEMRVAKDIAKKLLPVLATLKSLPDGVKVDALSFSPDYFDFDVSAVRIEFPEDSE
jgi:hypothetical protein